MKRIFFLILLAVMSTGIYAQTDDKGDHWRRPL